MISDPGTPTLDPLKVLLTVVEVGSFAGAARKLHRATSVMSYSISNLEMQLGVSLFDRKTTRKPQLTEAGRTVLAEARTTINGVNGLRSEVEIPNRSRHRLGAALRPESRSSAEASRPRASAQSCRMVCQSGGVVSIPRFTYSAIR